MRSLLIYIILMVSTTSVYNQNPVALRQPASEKSIPKLVVETFKTQYPEIFSMKSWYVTHLTYWLNDYSSDWYFGWYNQRTVVIYTYEKPNYYEVEFSINPNEKSRAIYNRYGYWYETRTQIKGLPKGILDAIKATKYNGWKISSTMEILESPMWPDEIYRFHVSKGIKSRIIRMDAEGNPIQIKELND